VGDVMGEYGAAVSDIRGRGMRERDRQRDSFRERAAQPERCSAGSSQPSEEMK
jgi:hypothetical protein